jgi:hypothetical protein
LAKRISRQARRSVGQSLVSSASFGQSFTDLKTLEKNAAADHGAIAVVDCGRFAAGSRTMWAVLHALCRMRYGQDHLDPSLCDGAPSSVAAEDMFV